MKQENITRAYWSGTEAQEQCPRTTLYAPKAAYGQEEEKEEKEGRKEEEKEAGRKNKPSNGWDSRQKGRPTQRR